MSNPQLRPRDIFPSNLVFLTETHDVLGINTNLPNYPAYGNNLVNRDHSFRMFAGPGHPGPNEIMYAQDRIRNIGINKDLQLLEITYNSRMKDTRYDQYLRMQPQYVDIAINPRSTYNNGVTRMNQA
jgi:hypothetical protein